MYRTLYHTVDTDTYDISGNLKCLQMINLSVFLNYAL